jgi:hypothetical protein
MYSTINVVYMLIIVFIILLYTDGYPYWGWGSYYGPYRYNNYYGTRKYFVFVM